MPGAYDRAAPLSLKKRSSGPSCHTAVAAGVSNLGGSLPRGALLGEVAGHRSRSRPALDRRPGNRHGRIATPASPRRTGAADAPDLTPARTTTKRLAIAPAGFDLLQPEQEMGEVLSGVSRPVEKWTTLAG